MYVTIVDSAYATVDGVECPIQELSPFNAAWLSHKFRGPALRNEFGVNFKIVGWFNGPFSA